MKLLIIIYNFVNNAASPFFGPVSIKYVVTGKNNLGNIFFRLDPDTLKYNSLIRSNVSWQHYYHSEVSAVNCKCYAWQINCSCKFVSAGSPRVYPQHKYGNFTS
jgi:hypothetical protein